MLENVFELFLHALRTLQFHGSLETFFEFFHYIFAPTAHDTLLSARNLLRTRDAPFSCAFSARLSERRHGISHTRMPSFKRGRGGRRSALHRNGVLKGKIKGKMSKDWLNYRVNSIASRIFLPFLPNNHFIPII